MKKAKELLKRMEEVFPLRTGEGRHSLLYVVPQDRLVLSLRLGGEAFPFTLDEKDLKTSIEVLVYEIRKVLDENAICGNCGERVRSLEGAAEIPTRVLSEDYRCPNQKTLAEWGMK